MISTTTHLLRLVGAGRRLHPKGVVGRRFPALPAGGSLLAGTGRGAHRMRRPPALTTRFCVFLTSLDSSFQVTRVSAAMSRILPASGASSGFRGGLGVARGYR